MAVAQPTIAAQPPKGWIATIVVALLMIGIVAGGFVAAASVANAPPILFNVNGVGINPASGWEFAGRSDNGQTILLTNGSGSVAITKFHTGGPVLLAPEEDALKDKRDEWLATGTVTGGEIVPVAVGPYTGRRFPYTGTFEDLATPVEGEVTAIDGTESLVLFDGWAGVGQYQTVSDDIDAMISSAVIP